MFLVAYQATVTHPGLWDIKKENVEEIHFKTCEHVNAHPSTGRRSHVLEQQKCRSTSLSQITHVLASPLVCYFIEWSLALSIVFRTLSLTMCRA